MPACSQYLMIANFIMHTLRVHKWWMGFLQGDLNRRHIRCYVKPEKVSTVRAVGLVEQLGRRPQATHQPGSRKLSVAAVDAKEWSSTWAVFESLWGISCSFSLVFPFIFRCWEQNINMNYWWIIRSPILLAVVVLFLPSPFFFYHNSLLFLKHLKCREACLSFEHQRHCQKTVFTLKS